VESALLAEPHQQYPVTQDVGHIVQQQHASRLAFHVAPAQYLAQITAGVFVEQLARGGEFAGLEHPDHDAGRALFFRATAFYAKFHVRLLSLLFIRLPDSEDAARHLVPSLEVQPGLSIRTRGDGETEANVRRP
jgi:hypothetical protein